MFEDFEHWKMECWGKSALGFGKVWKRGERCLRGKRVSEVLRMWVCTHAQMFMGMKIGNVGIDQYRGPCLSIDQRLWWLDGSGCRPNIQFREFWWIWW